MNVAAEGLQRRVHQRIQASFLITLAQATGRTINVSPAGLCLQHESDLTLGSHHYFEMMLSQEQGIVLTGVAKVLRKEQHDGQRCFGMKILQSQVELQ